MSTEAGERKGMTPQEGGKSFGESAGSEQPQLRDVRSPDAGTDGPPRLNGSRLRTREAGGRTDTDRSQAGDTQQDPKTDKTPQDNSGSGKKDIGVTTIKNNRNGTVTVASGGESTVFKGQVGGTRDKIVAGNGAVERNGKDVTGQRLTTPGRRPRR